MHESLPTIATPARRRPSPHSNRCVECPPDHFACGCREAYYDFEAWKKETAVSTENWKKMKTCACCGHIGGRCRRCLRMHSPAIEDGKCEGCKNEEAPSPDHKEMIPGPPEPLKQLRVDVTGYVVGNGQVSVPAFHVEVTSENGVWEEMFATVPERDAFLTGLKAASRLFGTREPDVRSGQGQSFTICNRLIVLSKEEKAFLASGKKIDAIKAVRRRLGLGLKEAKDLIDRNT